MRQNKNTGFYVGGSGLDRTDDFLKFCRSGLDRIQFLRTRIGLGLKNFTVCSSLTCVYTAEMNTDQDWIRNEANLGRIRTGSDCNIFEIWRIRTGSDWENFSCFNVIILNIWTYQKFQLSLDFTDLLNGSVYPGINGNSSAETILQLELQSLLSTTTYNAEFL